MDTNGDGVITMQEVPEYRRPMLQMMASRMGIDTSNGVSISKIRDTISGGRGEDQRSRDGNADKKSDTKRIEQKDPLVPGFGTEEEPPDLPEFGQRVDPIKRVDLGSGIEGATSKVDRSVRGYVQSMLRRFDRNHNNVLEREEWSGKPNNPGEKDRDRDGRITVAELAYQENPRDRMMRGRGGGMMGGMMGMGMGGMDGGDRYDDEGDSRDKEEARRTSYRFRKAHERLPEGLPDWFHERDTNFDGQVSMSEYARDWSDSVAYEYMKYDGNNDGVITPQECLSPSGGRHESGPPSASPPPSGSSPSSSSSPPAENKESSGDEKSSGDSSTPWWMQP